MPRGTLFTRPLIVRGGGVATQGGDDAFDVTAYGAKGDGVTDDTTAVSNGITAAGAVAGSTLFFPAGTYLTTTGWQIPSTVNGLTIWLSHGATLQMASGLSNRNILRFAQCTNVLLTGGGTLDGAVSSAVAGNCFGVIYSTGTNYCGVEGITINNTSAAALYIQTGTGNWVRRVRGTNNGSALATQTSFAGGIIVQGTTDCELSDCRFETPYNYGLFAGASGATRNTRLNISRIRVINCAEAASGTLAQLGIGSTDGLWVSGCTVQGVGTKLNNGLDINGCSRVRVLGNGCDSVNNGLFIGDNDTTDYLAEANVVTGSNTGVQVNALTGQTVTRVTLNGNHFEQTAALGYGAILQQTGSGVVSRVELVNNTFTCTGTTYSNTANADVLRRGNRYTSGAIQGQAVLSNGTATVNTAEILAADNIQLTRVVAGGTTRGVLEVGTIVAGTSFVINATALDGTLSADDDSTVFWEIVH